MDIKDFFNKINLKQIKEFVENQTEEDLFLEFKTVNHPASNEFDKKNFSKCLSGFANSNGGIIVWGVKASLNEKGIDAAKEIKPIKELSKLSNYFKKIEGQAVTPTISGVQQKKITTDGDKGFLITYVPRSDNCPHMANYADKHYYKRSGDSFYRCEHYDIVDMFNRRISPMLQVLFDNPSFRFSGSTREGKQYDFEGIIKIKNSGKAIAKFPALSVKISRPFSIDFYGIDGNRSCGLERVPSSNSLITKYTGGQDIVIHPDTELEVDKVSLKNFMGYYTMTELVIEYEVVAENMDLTKGVVKISAEDLAKMFAEVKIRS